jgi:hypothetical protein
MLWRGVALPWAVLTAGGLQGCIVGGPRPDDFAAMTHQMPPIPVCRHWYEAPGRLGPRRGYVTCEGDAGVSGADLRQAGVAEAQSMSSDHAFVVLNELINPVDEFRVQCEEVPIVPWSRVGLMDRRWKRRSCMLAPVGPRGRFLALAVQFGGTAHVDRATSSPPGDGASAVRRVHLNR